MNSGLSNMKLRGQMISEFYEFTIHAKLMKQEIHELKIKWFGFRIREIFYFQDQQKFGPKLGEIEEHNDLKHTINDLKLINLTAKIIDQISLLTWVQWRWGFNSRGLKWICVVSSSADIPRSRGKFDEIWRLITANPALIGSRSSLNRAESQCTQDLPLNWLNYFTNRSKVEKRREEHWFLKRSSPRKALAVRSDEGWLDGRDCV